MISQNKIGLDNGTVMDLLMDMSEGNPGGVTVLLQLMKENPKLDPDDCFGELGAVISLDNRGIYGSNIWVLYKHVCGESVLNMLAVLRGVQLGLLDESLVDNAILKRGSLDIPDILNKVRARLPRFGGADAVSQAPKAQAKCPECVGSGQVKLTFPRGARRWQVCPDCKGTGKVDLGELPEGSRA